MSPPPQNLLFYGTDTLSRAVLSRLLSAGHRVRTVTKHTRTPVYQWCEVHGVPVECYDKRRLPYRRDVWRDVLGVVTCFGAMIPGVVIRSTELGFVNIHPSLLPKYQGGSPLPHTLLNGDTETGVTILEALPRCYDKGRILHQVSYPVPHHITGSAFWDLTGTRMADTMEHYMEHFQNLTPVPQEEEGVSPAPKLSPTQLRVLSRVCPHLQTSDQIYNISRCLDLYKLAPAVLWGDTVLKLLSVSPIKDPHVTELARTHMATGHFVYGEGLLYVKCAGETVLGVSRMVLPKKPAKSAERFFRDNVHKGTDRWFRMVYYDQEELVGAAEDRMLTTRTV